MKKKPGQPPPRQPSEGKIVSIVGRIEQKRIEKAHQHALATHLRKAEIDAEMSTMMAELEEMDLDEGIAWCEGETGREARLSWTQLRSLRAWRSCMRGDAAAGLAEWAEIIAAEPGVASTYLMRSKWLGETDPAAALADCERAVVAEPTNPSTYARRGDCHRVRGDHERALADYRRAVSLDAGVSDVHYAMATVLVAVGKLEEARAAYTRAIKLAPSYVEFYLGRAAVLGALGDPKGAASDFARVRELDPSGDALRAFQAQSLAGAGEAARIVGKALEGMEGLSDDPASHDLFTSLGGLHLALGERDKAIEVLSHALELAPDDVTALGQRGLAYAQAGENQRALDDLDRAVAFAPNEVEYHVGRAKPLALLGRMEEAVEAASRAIALSPDHILAHRLRAVYRSHADDSEEGRALVKADIARAWELSPKSAVFRREYVDHLMDRGDVDEAMTVLDKALALEPRSAEIYYERGSCKNRRDEALYAVDREEEESAEQVIARHTSALADIQKAIALGKRDEDTYWELIRAREGMHDQPAYLAELDRVIAILPDFIMPLALRHSWRGILKDEEGAAADRARLLALGFKFRDD